MYYWQGTTTCWPWVVHLCLQFMCTFCLLASCMCPATLPESNVVISHLKLFLSILISYFSHFWGAPTGGSILQIGFTGVALFGLPYDDAVGQKNDVPWGQEGLCRITSQQGWQKPQSLVDFSPALCVVTAEDGSPCSPASSPCSGGCVWLYLDGVERVPTARLRNNFSCELGP